MVVCWILLHLVVSALKVVIVVHPTIADTLYSILNRRLNWLMCILLNIDIKFVYVDYSGSVLSLLALEVVEGIWSFRHWFYILYVFWCLKHCVALLRLSNPPRILLTKIFLSSIILHIMLIWIQIRSSMVVWHHLLLESIYKLLMCRLFLGVSIRNLWWGIDCWSFPWIVKIEVFNKLFYRFSYFFRIHPDEAVLQDLLS